MIMRLIRVVIWGVCLVPLALGGQGADWHAGAPKSEKLKGTDGKGSHGQIVTDEEWQRVREFMAVNCPNRLRFFDLMNDSHAQKGVAKRLIVNEYRQIERTKDKPLQDAMIREAQAQDKIFGAQIELRMARHEKEKQPAREQAKSKIRDAVGNLLDARVDRLRLESEHLRTNRSSLIKEWTDSMVHSANPAGAGVGSEEPVNSSPSSGAEADSPGNQ
jgi:hypothetical protein